ncbi:MAG: polyprenyl synthetase family protein, partial [Actinomycetota bacterium]
MNVTSPLLELPLMAVDRERVEVALRSAVRTPDAYLTEIASHLIVAGGKRLRPVLAVAAAQVGNDGAVSDNVIQGAIACELVHLGSLYHDDVMDESTTRRGVETVNAKWGNLQAIVAGDFLLARASEIAASLGDEIAGLLARTIGRLC